MVTTTPMIPTGGRRRQNAWGWPTYLLAGVLCAWLGCWGGMARAQLEDLPPIDSELPQVGNDSNWLSQSTGTSTTSVGRAGSVVFEGTGEYPPRDVPREEWSWQVMPMGLIYRSYLAGAKEPRFASYWNYDQNLGWLWDITLGGRVGLVRYGTLDPLFPKGWQLDIEGAAQPRLDMLSAMDLMCCDYRFGIPLTYSNGPWEYKYAFYHLSSHLGDEYMISHPDYVRYNYSRNALVWGVAYRPDTNVRIYGEADYAFSIDGGSKPWHFQFGWEYCPMIAPGYRAFPFVALNGSIRQDVNFGGNIVAQCGMGWRGFGAGHLFRAGFEYYNGKSRQYEFYNQFEQQAGLGIWYDF